jgi:hypothetical protein
MKWVTYNVTRTATTLLHPILWQLVRACQGWLSLALGAGYSSNCCGDRPRSPAAMQRRNASRRRKYSSSTTGLRTGTDGSYS